MAKRNDYHRDGPSAEDRALERFTELMIEKISTLAPTAYEVASVSPPSIDTEISTCLPAPDLAGMVALTVRQINDCPSLLVRTVAARLTVPLIVTLHLIIIVILYW